MLPLRARVDLKQRQWRRTLHSPKFQHYWNLTIRLICVINRTLVVGAVLSLCKDSVGTFLQPLLTGPDSIMEYEQMKFAFQHYSLCSLHTSSIDVAVLGSHWLKKSSITDTLLLYDLFSHWIFQLPTYQQKVRVKYLRGKKLFLMSQNCSVLYSRDTTIRIHIYAET